MVGHESGAVTIERSPADVLRLIVATVVLIGLVVVDALANDAVTEFVAEVADALRQLPSGLLDAVVVASQVGLWAALAVAVVWAIVRREARLAIVVVVAALLAAGLHGLLDLWLDPGEPAVWLPHSQLGFLTDDDFPPATTLAAASGAFTAAAPWLTRATRRYGWLLLVGLSFSRLLVAPIAFDIPVALVAGWAMGALVLVIAGGPSRRPDAFTITAGLAEVGIELADLERASVDARGSTPYFGTTTDGTKLFVKVLGEDERSADLLFRMYRFVQPRDLGDERPFSSLRRAVEHEALVAYAAQDVGVRTPRVVAFGRAEPKGFVLVYEAIAGRSLDGVEAAELTPPRVLEAWQQLAILRRHGIAHRDLRLANVFLTDEGELWIIDFGFSELAASDLLLATDLAELLTALSLKVGVESTVAAARQVLAPEVLATALPRLDGRFLAGATKTAVGEAPELLADLRGRLSAPSISTPASAD
jgi:undecaprenyl-diphosphatase